MPQFIANSPPIIANPDFKIGIHGGLGGATAILGVSNQAAPPGTTHRGVTVHIGIQPVPQQFSVVLSGSGAGAGHATIKRAIGNQPGLVGRTLFAQWFVRDGGASQGLSATSGAQLTIF